MPWEVVLTSVAERELRRLQSREREAVRRSLDRLAADPGRSAIQKLRAQGDEWRLRVGRLRVRFLFHVAIHKIEVLHVLPRGRAYRD